MRKIRFKHIFFLVVIIIIAVTFHQFYSGHRSDFMKVSKRYLSLFNDSIVENLDTLRTSLVADQDILNYSTPQC